MSRGSHPAGVERAMTQDEIARIAARILIETKSVLINAQTPFIFTSGWASPTYTDCRRLISFPRARRRGEVRRGTRDDSPTRAAGKALEADSKRHARPV